MEIAGRLSLERQLAASWTPADWHEVTVIVAVSGGPDSVALLRAMHALKAEAGGPGRLFMAHFNHHLRPEAKDDQAFVSNLAARLELPLELGEAYVENLAAERGDGLEAAAREARYTFLEQVAQRCGARYVATAHTADDQAETVLFNILRGTGLAGLAGMPRARPLGPAVSLIRPLLGIRRDEVLKYLAQLGQHYRVDPTNADHSFARNRLRHELLPLLRDKYNPEIEYALQRLSQLAGDAQQLIERLAGELLDQCLVPVSNLRNSSGAGIVRLNLAPLSGVYLHLRRELFVALWRRMNWPQQSMGFLEWNTLAEMAHGSQTAGNTATGKRIFPGTISVERRGDELFLAR